MIRRSVKTGESSFDFAVVETAGVADFSHELRNIDPPPFTYEGRKYTAYEAQQQMRKMERAMRRQKDRCIVADAAGDEENFTAASIKLRRQKDIYEDFCKAADSYTQYERTFVAGYDRRLAGKTGAVTRKQRAFDKAQMRLTDGDYSDIMNSESGKHSFEKLASRQTGIGESYVKSLEQKFTSANETAQKIFLKYVSDDSIADGNYKDTAHVSAEDHKIYMSFFADQYNRKGMGTTYFHEHGHYIDYWSCDGNGYTSCQNPKFADLLQSDFENYVQAVATSNGVGREKAFRLISGELLPSKFHSISDLFSGLSDNKCFGCSSHRSGYWKKNGKINREAFAHMFEAQFDPEKYALMNKYFPSAFAEFDNMLKGLL